MVGGQQVRRGEVGLQRPVVLHLTLTCRAEHTFWVPSRKRMKRVKRSSSKWCEISFVSWMSCSIVILWKKVQHRHGGGQAFRLGGLEKEGDGLSHGLHNERSRSCTFQTYLANYTPHVLHTPWSFRTFQTYFSTVFSQNYLMVAPRKYHQSKIFDWINFSDNRKL